LFITTAPAYGLDVIANDSVNVHSLNVAQLRRIYSMRQTLWSKNHPIIVYVLPSKHPIHKKFSKQMLHIFPYQLDRIWNKLTFSGLGVAPRVVNSQAELINIVNTTVGAIGYIDALDKDTDVNVIKIIE